MGACAPNPRQPVSGRAVRRLGEVRDPFPMEPPAGAEELWIDVDGVRVHAVEWNGAGERQVLLVHGLGGSTITWAPVAGELARRLPARITAVDLPGFGVNRPAAYDPQRLRYRRPLLQL